MKINGKPDGGGGREPIVESLSVTSNGIYTPEPGVDGFDNVDVNVNPALESLSVTFNGTYTPGQGVDGFSQVIVDVPQSVTGFTDTEITEGTVCIQNLYNSASYVGNRVFMYNSCLSTVSLPNASYIGQEAFMQCTNLSQVSLPNVSEIKYGAFSQTKLSQIDLPNCELIKGHAFERCTNLSQVSLPVCKNIGGSAQAYVDYEKAFSGCSSLTNIDLPMCSFIGPNTFGECINLIQISLPECEYIAPSVFINCKSLSMIDLPKCSIIERNAFANCWSLSQVSLPVCSIILNEVFRNCSTLSQAILPNIYSFGTGVFDGCSSFELLSFPTTNYVFYSYSNTLRSTKIANGVGSIYVPDFNYDRYISATGWSSLADRFVSVPVSETIFSYSDGLVYGQTNVLDYYFPSYFGVNYASIKGISLPNCTYVQTKPGTNPPPYPIKECANLQTLMLGVSEIHDSMCQYRYSLQYVELPNCKQIGHGAFSACTSLSSISLPECEYISDAAFIQCSALQSIDLPKCTSLSNGVFRYCSSLSSVNLPILKSLTTTDIFDNCPNLTYISLPECEYIGSDTGFKYLPLQSLDLPKCSYIGGTFFHCASLSQVSLPECEYLGYQAFRECNLQSIDLPKCSFIDSGAFASNPSFSEITLRSNTVCSLKDIILTFNNTALRNGNGSVYVPASLVDAYKTAQYWSELASQIFPIPE